MSTVILLSSSPPPVFARSPTPVRSSSPLPSTAALIQGQSPGRKRFKSRPGPREGFGNAFTTARAVLAEKSGAENAIITPGRNKFRSSQDEVTGSVRLKDTLPAPIAKSSSDLNDQAAPVQDKSTEAQNTTSTTESKAQCAQGLGHAKIKPTLPQPLLSERATARKLDWTPPAAKPPRDENERSLHYSAGYLNGMLSDFTYTNVSKPVQHTVEAHNPAKRRRVGISDKCTTNIAVEPMPILIEPRKPPPKVPARRTRSPTKKALTITALATSNYLGDDETTESPMMQYLTSTQAQLNDVPTESVLETKVQQTRAAAKRLKETKKGQTKSLLLSPTSAMKTYDDQDTIFGSASQLAREESPGLLRETIQAIKESESFMLSDSFSSPQRTQAASADNTPRAGTSKYRKTRNLWAAAGRDEDNALLHVDTVDLTDTPAVRAAFAGKDVLLQPAPKQLTPTCKPSVSLRGGCSPIRSSRSRSVIDIGDIPSPQANTKRAISSTSKTASPRKSPSRALAATVEGIVPSALDVPVITEPPPPKPNYAGLTIHELNKHIKSFGFKAMRKREKMIELLDRCWAEKYGVDEPPKEDEPEAVPFGDFLSKVHDISARPVPKAKKVKVSRKKAGADVQPTEKAVKKPRQRKKKDPTAENAGEKPKPQRKRKSKTMTDVDYSVHDVDSIWDTIPEELRALEAFDDWARPEKKSKPKSKSKSKTPNEPPPTTTTESASACLPTPPPTLQVNDVPASSAGFEEVSPVTKVTAPVEDVPKLTPTATPLSIESQITAAVMHQSQSTHPGRNHNTHPTWHEKILLYDPIILEDLAAWLNTEGLGTIGDDREISALEVREWCETKGICCLWRGGWRGNKLAQSQDQ